MKVRNSQGASCLQTTENSSSVDLNPIMWMRLNTSMRMTMTAMTATVTAKVCVKFFFIPLKILSSTCFSTRIFNINILYIKSSVFIKFINLSKPRTIFDENTSRIQKNQILIIENWITVYIYIYVPLLVFLFLHIYPKIYISSFLHYPFWFPNVKIKRLNEHLCY